MAPLQPRRSPCPQKGTSLLECRRRSYIEIGKPVPPTVQQLSFPNNHSFLKWPWRSASATGPAMSSGVLCGRDRLGWVGLEVSGESTWVSVVSRDSSVWGGCCLVQKRRFQGRGAQRLRRCDFALAVVK